MALAFAALAAEAQTQEDYLHMPGAIGLHSSYSTGRLPIDRIVELGLKQGLRVFAFNDNDRIELRYGAPPFRNLLARRIELNSVLKLGPDSYLASLEMARRKYPGAIILAGVEASPFYYWSGSPLGKNLVAKKWGEHLLVVSLAHPAHYAQLPIVHNHLSLGNFKTLSQGSFFFLIPLILGLLMARWERFYKTIGIVIIGMSALAIVNYHPLRSSPFDQYHGPQGVAPYQALINFAKSRGALIFWSHPEGPPSFDLDGAVAARTDPYGQDLFDTSGYTGLEVLYPGSRGEAEPGGLWDKLLANYVRGPKAGSPPWGIGGANCRADEKETSIGSIQTVFMVKSEDGKSAMEALASGRVYAIRADGGKRLLLRNFGLIGPDGKLRATMGDSAKIEGAPKLRITVESGEAGGEKVAVDLIRDGGLVKTFSGSAPLEIEHKDDFSAPGKVSYYRLIARGENERIIISNPIFVKFMPASAERANK